jgi:hypothetical protein
MFVGHFGVALAAKRVAPRTSLATLIAASSFIDLVWPVLLLAGVERVRIEPGGGPFTRLAFESYPISHSALLVVAWSAAFGAVYLWRTGYRAGALVTGALVASHWLVDLTAHLPDLPIWPGGPKVGLGLWNFTGATLAVELAIFGAGIAVYLAGTRTKSRAGSWGFAGFIAMLLFTYAASLLAPAPPSVTAIGVASLIGSAFTLAWAAWADRGRAVRVGGSGRPLARRLHFAVRDAHPLR